MRKILLTLSSVTLCMALTACSGDSSTSSTNQSSSTITTSTTESTQNADNTATSEEVPQESPNTQGEIQEMTEGMEGKMARGDNTGDSEGTNDKMAMREGMVGSEVTGGMGANREEMELPEGFDTMSEEEKQAYMTENGVEKSNNSNVQRGNLEMADSFRGSVTEIEDNVFTIVVESGESQKITIPKDLSVANGDYTRIMEGMNLQIGFDEAGTVISVTIVQ